MGKIDIAKQQETLSRLRDELGRLNQKFDETKKAMGLPVDEKVKIDPSEITPALKKAMEAAKAEAERVGAAAAAALTAETEAPAAVASHRPRRGAIAI